MHKKYKIKKLFDLALGPAGLDKYNAYEIVSIFSKIAMDVESDIVLISHCNDIHTDYQIVFNAAFSCTKSFRYPSIKKALSMDIILETDYTHPDSGFVLNYYVNVRDYIEKN